MLTPDIQRATELVQKVMDLYPDGWGSFPPGLIYGPDSSGFAREQYLAAFRQLTQGEVC